ncbi:unnamed protein product [Soboliphyme baturini]|uniref:Fork-head domain-containing protein n=1 Tax=Soboliphyme baturini TaxID=241478 RepID=A0A183IHH0_9BILA|nr:unnamed protein product [Soboliphyme baturini]
MQQRHYLMQQSLSTGTKFGSIWQSLLFTKCVSPSDLQKLWHDLTMGASLSPQELKAVTCLNGLFDSSDTVVGQRLLNGIPDLSLSAAAASQQQQPLLHPLFQHGVCLWPSCEKPCSNYLAFIQHLNSAHTLDDRSTAQCRVQMQVVDQLETQLNKERQRLQAMMHHLQMKQSPDTTTPTNGFPAQEAVSEQKQVSTSSPNGQVSTPLPQSQSSLRNILSSPAVVSGAAANSAASSTSDMSLSRCQLTSTPTSFTFTPPNSTVSVRRRVSDKSMLSIAADITRNREFYGSHDVRPPYTYASLIRQAIMESKEKQLTLNEIYNWFQDTFAYFRRNAATWKNAVRHNLSLHKCFTRVENVKGAVWTVDELEFYKRRPQRLSHGDSSFDLDKVKQEKQVKMEISGQCDETNSDEMAPSETRFSFSTEPSAEYQEMHTD